MCPALAWVRGNPVSSVREYFNHHRVQCLCIGGMAALILFISVMCLSAEDPLPPPLPEPTHTPEPTATPVPLATVIPAIHSQFESYRFSHFSFEYGVCFEGEFSTALTGDSPARWHTAAAEEVILIDLQGAVLRLLEAYDTGACEERVDFSAHPGRGTWLRHWSAGGPVD